MHVVGLPWQQRRQAEVEQYRQSVRQQYQERFRRHQGQMATEDALGRVLEKNLNEVNNQLFSAKQPWHVRELTDQKRQLQNQQLSNYNAFMRACNLSFDSALSSGYMA